MRIGVVPSLRRNNQLYAVSLMERTGGYGPSDMGSIPILRANKLILAIDGDASCREEVLR